uniref:Uncharacterized protein n=1 Tax=Tanacetum cinerariifolium TaxID=118510 RepID=A0A6L2MUE3_TANCI|nr:hypothetical protein [Tanacetum cinerariifolium]
MSTSDSDCGVVTVLVSWCCGCGDCCCGGGVCVVAAVAWWCCCGGCLVVVHDLESVDGYTDVVPFTYQVGGSQIQFGREEFCLLRNANVKWWEALYATPIERDSALPKYSLMGFTWAFKGAQPNRRVTPDAFEAQAEWWVSSRASFEGHIREPPQILSPINQHSRDDVPEDIYRHMAKQDRLLKEAWTKVEAHDSLINQMNTALQGMQVGTMPRPIKGSVDVREHYGLSDFSGFQNTQVTVDPRPQHGSSHNHDVSEVIPDVMNQKMRESHPMQSPYMPLSTTTVSPKKRADKNRNKMKNTNVSTFDFGKAGYKVMESFWRELVPQMYKGGYYMVDGPNKLGWLSDDMELIIRNRPHDAQFTVAKAWTASLHPGSKMCIIKTDKHIRGTLDGSTHPCPSWDDIEWVYMSINGGGNH